MLKPDSVAVPSVNAVELDPDPVSSVLATLLCVKSVAVIMLLPAVQAVVAGMLGTVVSTPAAMSDPEMSNMVLASSREECPLVLSNAALSDIKSCDGFQMLEDCCTPVDGTD